MDDHGDGYHRASLDGSAAHDFRDFLMGAASDRPLSYNDVMRMYESMRATADLVARQRIFASLGVTMSDIDRVALGADTSVGSEDMTTEPEIEEDGDEPPPYVEPTLVITSKGSCCENPQPRILEKNGRMFCNNCHVYLDKPRS